MTRQRFRLHQVPFFLKLFAGPSKHFRAAPPPRVRGEQPKPPASQTRMVFKAGYSVTRINHRAPAVLVNSLLNSLGGEIKAASISKYLTSMDVGANELTAGKSTSSGASDLLNDAEPAASKRSGSYSHPSPHVFPVSTSQNRLICK